MARRKSEAAPTGVPQFIALNTFIKASGLSRATIYRARRMPGFPRPVMFGTKPVFVVSELTAWLEGQRKPAAAAQDERTASRTGKGTSAPVVAPDASGEAAQE